MSGLDVLYELLLVLGEREDPGALPVPGDCVGAPLDGGELLFVADAPDSRRTPMNSCRSWCTARSAVSMPLIGSVARASNRSWKGA